MKLLAQQVRCQSKNEYYQFKILTISPNVFKISKLVKIYFPDMKNVMLISLCIIIGCMTQSKTKSSRNRCDELIPHFSGWYEYRYIEDYVKNKILENKSDSIYISDRKKLKLISPNIKKSKEIVFYFNGLSISISKATKSLEQLNDVKYEPSFIEGVDSFIASINNKRTYGMNIMGFKYNEIEVLQKIEINGGEKKYRVPDIFFNDLFFPNFYESKGPIRPIEVYKDEKLDCVYLYVFGLKKLTDDKALGMNAYDSYMAKYIFKDNELVSRIVVGIDDLRAYQWECPDFKGF